MAHLWAKWLCHPCRLGDPHRFRAGGEIRSGPLVGKGAMSPLPSRGSPPLQSGGGGNQKWPTSGQSAYVTPAVSGIPTASERGKNQKWPNCGQRGYVTPAVSGIPTAAERGGGGGDEKWPTCGQSGYVTPAVSGIPTASERGENQKWPTSGQSGYVTPAVSAIPTAAERGGKITSGPLMGKVATSPPPSRVSPPLRSGGGGESEVAHKWAKWPRHPCRLGDPRRCRARGKIRIGPQVGKMATASLPSRGSPPLQSGGENQKWPTCGQSGYVTPAVSGIATAAERGAKSQMAHLWAKWLRHPCRLGDPHCCRAGGEIRSGPLVGKVATSPLPSRGSPLLQSGGGNQRWPTCGQSGYVTPAVSGIPTAAERGGGGGDEKWPTSGQSGYVTPAVSGIPTAAERGAKSQVAHLWAKWLRHPCRLGDPHRCKARGGESEVAHKWAKWLRHPCRLGDPHRCRARGEIRSGPQVGKMATSPLPSRGSPPLQSGGENEKWPTCGQSGYVTPAVSGIPTASERGGNEKWPTCGQSGYVTPAVLGIPTAAERGGEIRSGPLVGKVATSPLPSRGSRPLQSGGKIRSGPLGSKVATSPLPSR